MKKKIIIPVIVLFVIVLILPYFLNENTSKGLEYSFKIISGISSLITVTIAVLLYDKYGIDKSIKDKNLEITLSLLEKIKSTTVFIENKDQSLNYRPSTFSMQWYEDAYKMKLVFSNEYGKDVSFLSKYSNSLYIPKQVKAKIDQLIPFTLTHIRDLNLEDYGKVQIKERRSKKIEWKYVQLNNEEVTLYDYLLKWEDLITTIREWCEKNSVSKVDLNIK